MKSALPRCCTPWRPVARSSTCCEQPGRFTRHHLAGGGAQGRHVRGHLAAQPDLRFALQEPQLGTAHAVQQVEPPARGPGRNAGASLGWTSPLLSAIPSGGSWRPIRPRMRRHRRLGRRRASLRLRAHRAARRAHRPHRRGTRRIAGRAEDHEINSGILRVQSSTPLFERCAHRITERAGVSTT